MPVKQRAILSRLGVETASIVSTSVCHNGLKKLAHEFEPERLNKACETAMRIGATSLNSLRSILKNGLDSKPILMDEHTEASFNHPNIRGADYYH